MTVKNLCNQLQKAIEDHSSNGDCEVSIEIEGNTIGPLPTVGISHVFLGFDWDCGKFIISPDARLSKEPQ